VGGRSIPSEQLPEDRRHFHLGIFFARGRISDANWPLCLAPLSPGLAKRSLHPGLRDPREAITKQVRPYR
jgi:hypothetical protein